MEDSCISILALSLVHQVTWIKLLFQGLLFQLQKVQKGILADSPAHAVPLKQIAAATFLPFSWRLPSLGHPCVPVSAALPQIDLLKLSIKGSQP